MQKQMLSGSVYIHYSILQWKMKFKKGCSLVFYLKQYKQKWLYFVFKIYCHYQIAVLEKWTTISGRF